MTEQSTVTLRKATPATLPDAQTVTEVEHYTDSLFRFRVTRPASLRFRSGEFVMIGLMSDPDPVTGKQKPLLRALYLSRAAQNECPRRPLDWAIKNRMRHSLARKTTKYMRIL